MRELASDCDCRAVACPHKLRSASLRLGVVLAHHACGTSQADPCLHIEFQTVCYGAAPLFFLRDIMQIALVAPWQ